jgi:hypothetical protein
MNTQQQIVYRLILLISKGEEALQAIEQATGYLSTPEKVRQADGLYLEWRLGSLSFLSNVLGPDNLYSKRFAEISPIVFSSNIAQGLGILRAVKSEVEFGPIPATEALLSAEIFENFLEMAEHLLEQKYFAVVPSLVGAVLEDGLRRIAKKRDVMVKKDDNIGGLNTRLFDANAYNALTRKKIEVWNTIRNNADHGNFDVNSPQDIKQMLDGVRDFLGTNLR